MDSCEPRRSLHTRRYRTGPKEVEHWSLTTLREKLVKIGAKIVRHGRYVTFQGRAWWEGIAVGRQEKAPPGRSTSEPAAKE